MESEGLSSCSQDLPLFHTVIQSCLIHTFLLYLFNAHFNIILPHMLMPSKQSLVIQGAPEAPYPVCISVLPIHDVCPAHLALLD